MDPVSSTSDASKVPFDEQRRDAASNAAPEAGRATKAFVLHTNYRDVQQHRSRFHQGIEPDETPYGLHHGQRFGFEVSHSRPTRKRLIDRIASRLLGFDIRHVYKNADLIEQADIVWTTSEREYLAVLFAAKMGRLRQTPKMIGQTVWLLNDWSSFSAPRRVFYRSLIKDLSLMTVHSEKNIPVIEDDRLPTRHRLLLFGISTDSYPPRPFAGRPNDGKIRIFSAGTDKSRDWDTLYEAFADDDRFEVVIANKVEYEKRARFFSNFKPLAFWGVRGLTEGYIWADFVAITLKENRYSGITVALEATALGVPILCSDTGGVPTYFDRGEVLYVPPGDPAALRKAALATPLEVRRGLVSAAQRKFVEKDYTTVGLSARYAEASREVLAGV